MKQLLIPALLLAMLTACSTTDTSGGKGANVETRDPQTKSASDGTVNTSNLGASGLPSALTDPKNILSRRSIYFDLDKYEVKDDYRELLAAHAKFLNGNRQFKVMIQGNTDERGSREYNLSLGQKRAESVKRNLTLLGVNEDQLEAVSLGEEKPKAEGRDEAAYAENRRADILYKGPTGTGEF
ncbi:MAG TPA: peptidoglycan-associated lipoprotein Pal [Rhodocyclaceae bacterium]|nr:peptidoglycan-associated lipoprotein Pal [Rhodocyclaceae bacterium]